MPTFFFISLGVLAIVWAFHLRRSHKTLQLIESTPTPERVDKFLLETVLHLRTSINTIYTAMAVVVFLITFMGYNVLDRIVNQSVEVVRDSPAFKNAIFSVDSTKRVADSVVTNARSLFADAAQIQRALEMLQKRGFVASNTTPGSTNWEQYTDSGLTVLISTERFKFQSTPIYLPVLVGEGGHWQTLGGSSVYSPTATSFRVYVFTPNRKITPAFANTNKWIVQWTAFF